MSSVLNSLPAPTRSVGISHLFTTQPIQETRIVLKNSQGPSYPNRKGWIPRNSEDFGDGGKKSLLTGFLTNIP